MAAQKIHSRMENQHNAAKSRAGRHNTLVVRYQTLPTKDVGVDRKPRNGRDRRYSYFDDVTESPRKGAIRCSVRYFCFGACLVFVGSILLCALGFTIVLPYSATRHWPEVTCNVTNSSFRPDTCSCERVAPVAPLEGSRYDDCTMKFPCLHIFVQYTTTTAIIVGDHNENNRGDNQVTTTAFLYRSWSDAFYNACSIHECGDEQWTIRESRRFRSGWGKPGRNYSCFFDPRNRSRVIVQRTQESSVMHAILWPTLTLACGAFIWLGLCFGCCQIEADTSSPPPPRHGPGLL